MANGCLINHPNNADDTTCHYFSIYNAKLYDINLEADEYREIPVEYEKAELQVNTAGFCEESDWLKYCCMENSFHSLKDFLDDSVSGNVFEKEKQIRSYKEINASCKGDCGKRVHERIGKELRR